MKMSPFLEYIVYDVFGDQEPITFRPMMGSYILYYEGKAFAIVNDEELYFKGSKELASWYQGKGVKQFVYQKEGKEAYLYYFLVPSEIYEERVTRNEWLDIALLVATPPKVKNKKQF